MMHIRLSGLAAVAVLVAMALPEAFAQPADERAAIAREMETALDELLDAWYPRVIDEEHGGFLSRFRYDWQPEEPQDKMIVTQARHVWTTSKAAERFPDEPLYRRAAAHGVAFLRDVLWDDTHGGFYTLVSREGDVQGGPDALKTAYGNAFGIYALAAYAHLSGDADALAFAQEAFTWLDTHSHDPEYGGYFQFLQRDGTPLTAGSNGTPPKDQNSSIHLLEAFTELYLVWPDDRVRDRLDEMLRLVRDTLVVDPGYLTLFSRADWTPVSYRDSTDAAREAHYALDHVSFGHDVETAYLMLEASHALGLNEDAATSRTGKQMVDHALKSGGWDDEVGGFFDEGYYFKGTDTLTIIRPTKTWWAQAEALNTLLLMADAYPDDPLDYFDKFQTLWTYTQAYLLDPEHGGWYDSGLDRAPQAKTRLKAQIWKGNYHTARTLMNCIDRLYADAE